MPRLSAAHLSELRFGEFGHLKNGSQLFGSVGPSRVCKSTVNSE